MRGRAASGVSLAAESVVRPRLGGFKVGRARWSRGEGARCVAGPKRLGQLEARDAAPRIWRLRRTWGASGSGRWAEVGAFGVRTAGTLVDMSEVVRAGRRRRTVRSIAVGTKCKTEKRSICGEGRSLKVMSTIRVVKVTEG